MYPIRRKNTRGTANRAPMARIYFTGAGQACRSSPCHYKNWLSGRLVRACRSNGKPLPLWIKATARPIRLVDMQKKRRDTCFYMAGGAFADSKRTGPGRQKNRHKVISCIPAKPKIFRRRPRIHIHRPQKLFIIRLEHLIPRICRDKIMTSQISIQSKRALPAENHGSAYCVSFFFSAFI